MDARARAMAKWPQESAAAVATRVEDFLNTYSSIEKLQEFWTDVKDLTWAESYGPSPWPFATSVAYQVFSSDHRADPILCLQQRERFLFLRTGSSSIAPRVRVQRRLSWCVCYRGN